MAKRKEILNVSVENGILFILRQHRGAITHITDMAGVNRCNLKPGNFENINLSMFFRLVCCLKQHDMDIFNEILKVVMVNLEEMGRQIDKQNAEKEKAKRKKRKHSN